MKKIISFLLLVPMLFVSVQAGAFASLYLGYTRAILESVTNKRAEVGFSSDIKDPPQYSSYPIDGKFIVQYKLWDDSRLAGYKLNVWETLDRFNFTSWTWVLGGTGNSNTGSDTRTGKYNTSGFWDIYPLQPSPVTRYKVTLSADTKTHPRKTLDKIFYVAKTVPAGARTDAQRAAAPAWIVGRLERATVYKNLADTWRARRNSSSSINYGEEMMKIIISTGSLFGPTDITSYSEQTGLKFLELASNVFGTVATSSLVAAGGAVYQAYDWGKWAKNTLQASADLWNSTLTNFKAQQTAGQVGTSLETALDNLASAMRDEANEAMRIIYTNPYDSSDTWLSLLSLEKTRAQSAAAAASTAMDKAKTIAGESSEIYKFFECINKMANSDWYILNAAMP